MWLVYCEHKIENTFCSVCQRKTAEQLLTDHLVPFHKTQILLVSCFGVGVGVVAEDNCRYIEVQ